MPELAEIAPRVHMNVRTKKGKHGSISAINPATAGPELEVLVNWEGGGSSWIPWAGLEVELPHEEAEAAEIAESEQFELVANVIIPALRLHNRTHDVHAVAPPFSTPQALKIALLVDGKPVTIEIRATR